MKKGEIKLKNRFYFVLFSVLLCLILCIFLIACKTTQNGNDGTKIRVENNKFIKDHKFNGESQKISSQILNFITLLSEGKTSIKNTEKDVSSHGVKVNEHGMIQTYIYLYDIYTEMVKNLETYGAVIEIVNYNLKIVQAWVPLDAIHDIAELVFVKKITTPEYAISK